MHSFTDTQVVYVEKFNTVVDPGAYGKITISLEDDMVGEGGLWEMN